MTTYAPRPAHAALLPAVLPKDFQNIAHMTNSKGAIDWALGQGANGLEFDVSAPALTSNPLPWLRVLCLPSVLASTV